MGFGVWGLGFGVWGLGFGVWGSVKLSSDLVDARSPFQVLNVNGLVTRPFARPLSVCQQKLQARKELRLFDGGTLCMASALFLFPIVCSCALCMWSMPDVWMLAGHPLPRASVLSVQPVLRASLPDRSSRQCCLFSTDPQTMNTSMLATTERRHLRSANAYKRRFG